MESGINVKQCDCNVLCFAGSADRVLVPPWHGSVVQLEGTPAPVRDRCLCLCMCVKVISFLSQRKCT